MHTSLIRDGDPEVRQRAAWDLGRESTNVKEAVLSLADALNDEFVDVRRQAMLSLFLHGHSSNIVRDRIVYFISDADLVLRRAAIATLCVLAEFIPIECHTIEEVLRQNDEMSLAIMKAYNVI